MTNQPRPVFLSGEDILWLERVISATETVPGAPRQTPARSIIRAWGSAPADPVAATQAALLSDGRLGNISPLTVLRALGMPEVTG